MAIDTRDKRASCIMLNLPFLARVWPNPDGAFNQGDRQQIAWLYRGILATPAIIAEFAGSVRRMTGYGT